MMLKRLLRYFFFSARVKHLIVELRNKYFTKQIVQQRLHSCFIIFFYEKNGIVESID